MSDNLVKLTFKEICTLKKQTLPAEQKSFLQRYTIYKVWPGVLVLGFFVYAYINSYRPGKTASTLGFAVWALLVLFGYLMKRALKNGQAQQVANSLKARLKQP